MDVLKEEKSMKRPWDWNSHVCIRALHDAIVVSHSTSQVAAYLDKSFFSTYRGSKSITRSMVISGIRRDNVADIFARLFPQETQLLLKFERNQNSGKRRKLQLPPRVPRVLKQPPTPKAKVGGEPQRNGVPHPARYAPLARPGDIAPPQGEGGRTVKVLDLTSRMCKFPIGDPSDIDFAFCGRTVSLGRPYCPDHVRITSIPIKKR